MQAHDTGRLGLEGVIAAETEMSWVDGERGRLVLRGHDIETLAGRVPFEAVCGLLWDGTHPVPESVSGSPTPEIRARLAAARVAAFARLDELGLALSSGDGMAALRAGLAQLEPSRDATADRFGLTGAAAVFVAAWSRIRAGMAPVPPDPALGHAADYLRMLEGGAPADPRRCDALDAYLVTVVDHGMNASTFAARVVASTDSDVVSAVTAAVCALKGPLHGGAPGPVLDMLRAIGTPENAASWLEQELSRGGRIMGMGHRVYKVRDPRAAVLERQIEMLERAGIAPDRLGVARGIERVALELLRERKPERPLKANVEFYTAVLLDAIGLPPALFSPTFAVARVAGWLAHIAEQRERGRLLRPRARYVGPDPGAIAESAV